MFIFEQEITTNNEIPFKSDQIFNFNLHHNPI